MSTQKRNHRTERNLKTRARLWPDLENKMIWSSKKNPGYFQIPRTMPYFFKIMNALSKAKPLSRTYFALWCRCWDESMFTKIDNPALVAAESGFSGQRAVATWKARMKLLEKYGFIRSAPLGTEEFGYVVILNPYKVVKAIHERGDYADTGWFNALHERATNIKATDLEDDN